MTKTENVKTFINQVGKENQLFLFIGSNNIDSTSNSAATELETWRYSDFSIKIGKDNIIPVVPNVKWTKKRTYTPWNAKTENYGNFYAYNEQNGYVYLCLSDNKDNRADYLGKNVTNNIPTHVSGDYTYNDGYTWKALYKITPNIEKFVTEQWIPVVSFDIFEDLDKSSLYAQMQTFCSPSSTSSTGYCAIYFKQNIKYLNGSGVETQGQIGTLYDYFENQCHECYNTFKDHPNFIASFTANIPSQTLEIKDTYDLIGDLIDQKKISTASPYYYLYQANKDSPNEGYIVSATIDLGGMSQDDISIDTENPELTLSSNTGSGASVKLKTYRSAVNNKIYIYGIEVVSGGSGYKSLSLALDSANLLGTMTKDKLLAAININIDQADGLGFDPMKVLNCKHSMIDVRVDKPTLETSNLPLPTHMNFYSLVQNPKYDSSFDIVAGSTENKYLSTLYRTTTKVTATLPIGAAPIEPDDSGDIVLEDEQTEIKDILVSSTTPNAAGTSAKIELKGIEFKDSGALVGGRIYLGNVAYTITSVDSSPTLIQYSGKVISTNKTTDITINDSDTASIRINMVKGM